MPRKRRPKLTANQEAAAERVFGEDAFQLGQQTRWQPGQSGNLLGRPPEPDGATDLLVYLLKKQGLKELAGSLISLAQNRVAGAEGKVPYTVQLSAIQYIYDRIEGRPRQSIIEEHKGEHPLVELFRRLNDDNRALEGRSLAALPVGPIFEAEVREVAGPDTGAAIP